METSRTRLCITGQVELLTVVPRSLDGELNSPRRSVNGAKNPYPRNLAWGCHQLGKPDLCDTGIVPDALCFLLCSGYAKHNRRNPKGYRLVWFLCLL